MDSRLLQLSAIVFGTFVSEDLTCISVGLWIRQGQLSGWVGVVGCFAGIFLGDVGLWLVGRFLGSRVLALSWIKRRIPTDRVDSAGRWFDRHGWAAIVGARFLPGARLPVYLAAGAVGRATGRFMLFALIACLVWTPLLIALVVLVGDSIVKPLETLLGTSTWAILIAAIVLLVLVRCIVLSMTVQGRGRLMAKVSRIWRWEFWPAWLFYLPMVPWILYLAFRYKGFGTITAANPGIPAGGIVGESKHDILKRLPGEWIVPTALIEAGEWKERVNAVLAFFEKHQQSFPVILKPDMGERGAGLRLAKCMEDVEQYLRKYAGAVLIQAYHAGPFEAGVFYYRMPGDDTGHILSITDKRFPVLIGDGQTDVETMIWQHPRFRMQARTFLARLNGQSDRVPWQDERIPLAVAGNHCQGTLFQDGSHLMTPELSRSVDIIAKSFDGFWFGRFDVRYCDPAEFAAGRGFSIVELNGVTSESTNIYDPTWTLTRAYRQLMTQWKILFQVGDANRRAGHATIPTIDIWRRIRGYYKFRNVEAISD